jgi:ABC-type dipeptide/oligopeptide/nickel transport system permease component
LHSLVLVRRLLSLPITVFLSVSVVFVLLRAIPGDPVLALVAASGMPAREVERFRDRYGLDRPLPVQYLRYWSALFSGDLGVSLAYGRPVGRLIAEQLPATARLTLAAFAVCAGVGLALGVASAWWRGSWLDLFVQVLAGVSASIPPFWAALLGIYLFSVRLQWLPASGDGSLRHLVLPALVLAGASFGPTARLARSSVLEVVGQDFVRGARAKGLPGRVVLCRHVLPAAASPVIAFLGLQVGFLLSGAAITETVFARPGFGRLLVEAVLAKDYPLAQGCVVVAAVLYSLANSLSDAVCALVDPRLRDL